MQTNEEEYSSNETEFVSSINIETNIESAALMQDEISSAIGFYHLTEARVDEAIDILIQKLLRTSDQSIYGTFDDEPEIRKEIGEFYRDIFTDGFSVVAVDESDGKVIAVTFIKIRLSKNISEEDFFMKFYESCQNEWLKKFINSLMKLETSVDLCYFFDIPYYLQIVATAVLAQYEQSDLSCLLLKVTVALTNQMTSEQQAKIKMQVFTSVPFEEIIYMPPLIAFIAVNEYAKDFLTKLDFMEISTVPYENIDVNVSYIPDTLKKIFKNICFMIHWKRTENQRFPCSSLCYS